MKFKPLAVEPSAVAQLRAYEVEKALLVDDDLHAIVFKRLVVVVHHVVEIQLVHETAASATLHADADETPCGASFFGEQTLDLVACVVIDFDHVWKTCYKNTPFGGCKGTLFGFNPNKLVTLFPPAASHLWGMAGARKSQPRRSRAQLTTQFTTVVGMSLTLFLLGMLGLAGLLGQWATLQLKQRVHVQVYLQREMTQAQIDGTRLALAADPSVAAATYLDPEEAASELESELGESFVSFLGYVPLPPVVDVVVRPDHATPEGLAEAAARFEATQGVADVSWNGDLLSAMQAGIDRLMPVLMGAAGLCLLIALALLNNTIRLSVFARRFLIRNMQLVGAQPRLVRRPFVVQGLLLGATSGLIAFAGTLGILTWFQAQLGTMSLPWIGLLAALFVGVGGLLGAGFSSVAVNRYLSADLSQLH